MMKKELIVYTRTRPCPFINTAKYVLDRQNVPYHEIFIDQDPEARARVIAWTGFESVPTLVIAAEGEILPIVDPDPLPKGASPRGIDRGFMLTEASAGELEAWLQKHDLLPKPTEQA